MTESTEKSNEQRCIPISKLTPDVLGDLKQMLENNLKKVLRRYASYVSCILRSVKERNISPETLCSYLLNLPAFGDDKCSQKLTLLSGLRTELENATTVNKIFNLLSTEYASFLDYDIFEFIIEEYDIDESRPRMKYPEYLEAFINQHKLAEFVEINPLLKDFSDSSKELILKIDMELTCSLARLKDLTKAIASILGIKKSALRLLDVAEGCVVVSLLISAPIADFIFADEKFTSQQGEDFISISVLWLKYNNIKYEFSSGEKATCTLTKINTAAVEEEFIKIDNAKDFLQVSKLNEQYSYYNCIILTVF